VCQTEIKAKHEEMLASFSRETLQNINEEERRAAKEK